MLRIYCDWNNGIDERRFDLSCPGSMKEIDRNRAELKDGTVVIFYDDELQAEGTIHFDEKYGLWFGVPDFSTARDIGYSAPE